MKKDTHKTKVMFLVNNSTFESLGLQDAPGLKETNIYKDIYAYFPEEVFDNKGNKTAYSHMGQHSGVCDEYVKESIPATAEEREDLIKELENLGYNLEIIN